MSTIKMSDSLKTEEAARAGFCGQYLANFPAPYVSRSRFTYDLGEASS
jgi:hypothetical protein